MLVRNVLTTCLDKLLIERDVRGAVEYVKGVISDLLMNRLDLSLLVVSKGDIALPLPTDRATDRRIRPTNPSLVSVLTKINQQLCLE